MQHDLLAVAVDGDRPLLLRVVPGGALGGRGAPVVDLHDPRVHLEPVADLVLRREDRPVLRERQVGQVVVPDGVVQAQRLVAAAPLVAGAGVPVDDDVVDAELAQPRAQRDAALAAADHHDVGLAVLAETLDLGGAPLLPGDAVLAGAVLDALGTAGALVLLVALELVERGQEGPGALVVEPQQARAAPDRGLEGEPGRGDAVGLLGLLAVGDPEVRGVGRLHGVAQQVVDPVAVLDGREVPGERDQVAPEGGGGEQAGGALGVAGGQCRLEVGQPGLDAPAGRGRLRGRGGLEGLRHRVLPPLLGRRVRRCGEATSRAARRERLQRCCNPRQGPCPGSQRPGSRSARAPRRAGRGRQPPDDGRRVLRRLPARPGEVRGHDDVRRCAVAATPAGSAPPGTRRTPRRAVARSRARRTPRRSPPAPRVRSSRAPTRPASARAAPRRSSRCSPGSRGRAG